MEIYNIKFINDGLKGAEVSYTEQRTEKNGRKFTDDITKEKNDPVHLALDRPWKDLRGHLLEMCGLIDDRMDDAEVKHAIFETEITSVKVMKTFFIIEGEREWLNNKRFKLKTPKVERKDNYVNYDTVLGLIEEIKKEAEIFIKGTASVSDEEIAVRYLSSGKNKSFTMDDYNNMTKEEKAKWHIEYVENELGGIVTRDEDIIDEDKGEIEQEEQTIDLNETF